MLPAAPQPAPDTTIALADTEPAAGDLVPFSADGFLPFENVYATVFSAPVFAGWFQANGLGVVQGSFAVPAGLPDGEHTVQLAGASSGFVAASGFQLAALAPTGVQPEPLVVGSLVLLLGGLMLVLARSRHRRGGRSR